VLHETRDQKLRRIRREWRRVGPLRFLDVLAFRAYYRLALASRDARWSERQLANLRERFSDPPAEVPTLHTHSPNTAEAEEFIRRQAPDIMVARCKLLLKEAVFTIPRRGTLVLHPGICPEYRNAHGCFWALANGDNERVGVTLLRIDKGVDTGPVYGYYCYDYDARTESHIVIQQRSLFENLDAVRARFEEIARGDSSPIDTTGRESHVWGQPWLSRYVRLRAHARHRQRL
jgi:methionyl-tRNA formyltransferase